MTPTIIIMILIGIVFIFASFFISEKVIKQEKDEKIDLLTVNEEYEFSERELQIIKSKIEDVIANQARDILYETNDSLSSMANEKTLALGDYAVTVCDEIEKNHKEVLFLYSMLDDKQKEIMNTIKQVDELKAALKTQIDEFRDLQMNISQMDSQNNQKEETEPGSNPVLQEERTSENEIDESQKILPNEEVEESEEEDIFSEVESEDFDGLLEEEFCDSDNSNEIILDMYRKGNSILEIAKQLGLGVGEVRLVIDLYQGDKG